MSLSTASPTVTTTTAAGRPQQESSPNDDVFGSTTTSSTTTAAQAHSAALMSGNASTSDTAASRHSNKSKSRNNARMQKNNKSNNNNEEEEAEIPLDEMLRQAEMLACQMRESASNLSLSSSKLGGGGGGSSNKSLNTNDGNSSSNSDSHHGSSSTTGSGKRAGGISRTSSGKSKGTRSSSASGKKNSASARGATRGAVPKDDKVPLEIEQERLHQALDLLSQPSYETSSSLSNTMLQLNASHGSSNMSLDHSNNRSGRIISHHHDGSGSHTSAANHHPLTATNQPTSSSTDDDVEAAIRASQEMAMALQALSANSSNAVSASPSGSPKNGVKRTVMASSSSPSTTDIQDSIIYEDLSSPLQPELVSTLHGQDSSTTHPEHQQPRNVMSSLVPTPQHKKKTVQAATAAATATGTSTTTPNKPPSSSSSESSSTIPVHNHKQMTATNATLSSASIVTPESAEENEGATGSARNVTQVKWEKIDTARDGDDDFVPLKDYSKFPSSSSQQQNKSKQQRDAVQWEEVDLFVQQDDVDYSPLVDYSKPQAQRNNYNNASSKSSSPMTGASSSVLQKGPLVVLSNHVAAPQPSFQSSSPQLEQFRRRRAATKRRKRKIMKMAVVVVVLLVIVATAVYLYSSSTREGEGEVSAPEVIEQQAEAAAMGREEVESVIMKHEEDKDANHHRVQDVHDDAASHVVDNASSGHEHLQDEDEGTMSAERDEDHVDDDSVRRNRRGGRSYQNNRPACHFPLQSFFGTKCRRGRVRIEDVEEFLSFVMQ